MEKNKNKQIEGLRGIGCIFILIYHIYVRYIGIYVNDVVIVDRARKIYLFGSFGVTIFLVISAWFFVRNQAEINTIYLDIYLIKRLVRLWIPYVFSISVIFIFEQLIDLGDRKVSNKEFLVNITMLQDFFANVKAVDGAHWYISTILVFMVIVFIIERNMKYKFLAYFSWLLLGYLSYFVEIKVNGVLLQREYIGVVVATIMLKYVYNNNLKSKQTYSFKEWVPLIIYILSLIYTVFYHNAVYAIWMFVVQMVLILAISEKMSIFSNVVLVELGALSYYIYLIHQNLSYMIMSYIQSIVGEYHYWYGIVAIFISIFFAFFIKLLSTRLITTINMRLND